MINVIEYYNFLYEKNKSIMEDINAYFKTIYEEKDKVEYPSKEEIYRKIITHVDSHISTNPIFKNIINIEIFLFSILITLKNNVGLELYYSEGDAEIKLHSIYIKDSFKKYRFSQFSIRMHSVAEALFGNRNEFFRICEYKDSSGRTSAPNKRISKSLPILKKLLSENNVQEILDYLFFNNTCTDFENKLSLLYDVNCNDLSVFKLNLIKKFK